jgi:hypothetical protein
VRVLITPVPLGRVVWTRGVNEAVAGDAAFAQLALDAIVRHTAGDWGDVPREDWRANDRSLDDGTRLLSAYRLPDAMRDAISAPDDRLWIITEADRSVTTLLWPSEY